VGWRKVFTLYYLKDENVPKASYTYHQVGGTNHEKECRCFFKMLLCFPNAVVSSRQFSELPSTMQKNAVVFHKYRFVSKYAVVSPID
jgi:hypothetical protein